MDENKNNQTIEELQLSIKETEGTINRYQQTIDLLSQTELYNSRDARMDAEQLEQINRAVAEQNKLKIELDKQRQKLNQMVEAKTKQKQVTVSNNKNVATDKNGATVRVKEYKKKMKDITSQIQSTQKEIKKLQSATGDKGLGLYKDEQTIDRAKQKIRTELQQKENELAKLEEQYIQNKSASVENKMSEIKKRIKDLKTYEQMDFKSSAAWGYEYSEDIRNKKVADIQKQIASQSEHLVKLQEQKRALYDEAIEREAKEIRKSETALKAKQKQKFYSLGSAGVRLIPGIDHEYEHTADPKNKKAVADKAKLDKQIDKAHRLSVTQIASILTQSDVDTLQKQLEGMKGQELTKEYAQVREKLQKAQTVKKASEASSVRGTAFHRLAELLEKGDISSKDLTVEGIKTLSKQEGNEGILKGLETFDKTINSVEKNAQRFIEMVQSYERFKKESGLEGQVTTEKSVGFLTQVGEEWVEVVGTLDSFFNELNTLTDFKTGQSVDPKKIGIQTNLLKTALKTMGIDVKNMKALHLPFKSYREGGVYDVREADESTISQWISDAFNMAWGKQTAPTKEIPTLMKSKLELEAGKGKDRPSWKLNKRSLKSMEKDYDSGRLSVEEVINMAEGLSDEDKNHFINLLWSTKKYGEGLPAGGVESSEFYRKGGLWNELRNKMPSFYTGLRDATGISEKTFVDEEGNLSAATTVGGGFLSQWSKAYRLKLAQGGGEAARTVVEQFVKIVKESTDEIGQEETFGKLASLSFKDDIHNAFINAVGENIYGGQYVGFGAEDVGINERSKEENRERALRSQRRGGDRAYRTQASLIKRLRGIEEMDISNLDTKQLLGYVKGIDSLKFMFKGILSEMGGTEMAQLNEAGIPEFIENSDYLLDRWAEFVNTIKTKMAPISKQMKNAAIQSGDWGDYNALQGTLGNLNLTDDTPQLATKTAHKFSWLYQAKDIYDKMLETEQRPEWMSLENYAKFRLTPQQFQQYEASTSLKQMVGESGGNLETLLKNFLNKPAYSLKSDLSKEIQDSLFRIQEEAPDLLNTTFLDIISKQTDITGGASQKMKHWEDLNAVELLRRGETIRAWDPNKISDVSTSQDLISYLDNKIRSLIDDVTDEGKNAAAEASLELTKYLKSLGISGGPLARLQRGEISGDELAKYGLAPDTEAGKRYAELRERRQNVYAEKTAWDKASIGDVLKGDPERLSQAMRLIKTIEYLKDLPAFTPENIQKTTTPPSPPPIPENDEIIIGEPEDEKEEKPEGGEQPADPIEEKQEKNVSDIKEDVEEIKKEIVEDEGTEKVGGLGTKPPEVEITEPEPIPQIEDEDDKKRKAGSTIGGGGSRSNGSSIKIQNAQVQSAIKLEKAYQQYLNQRFALLSKIEAAQAQANISTGREKEAAEGVIKTRQIELEYLDKKNAALVQSMEAANSSRKADLDYAQSLKVASMQQEKLLSKKGATSLWTLMANDIKRATMRVMDFGVAARALNKIPQTIQGIIRYTKELDKAMTNIRIVGGYNQEQAEALMRSYNKLAQTLGTTTTAVAESANEWLRQGYSSQEQLEKLIDASTKLSKLGMISASGATSALTSALKAFNLTAEDAIKVVDKLTRVDQLASVSAGGISEALRKAATSAKLAGMSMDELIGAVSTIGEVTQQSMDTVGNAMKSIFARYGNVKAGVFTQMGLNDEGMTSENINDIEKVLSKLGIRLRSTGTDMRSITDVLDELNEKWITFDDVTKNAIATAFGGTRMRENFLVLMENWESVQEFSQESEMSEGTATEKYGAELDSIEAKVNKLQAAWEGFTQSLETSWLVKTGLNIATGFVEDLEKIIKLVMTLYAFNHQKQIFGFLGNTGRQLKEGIGQRLSGIGKAPWYKVTYDKESGAPILGDKVTGVAPGKQNFITRAISSAAERISNTFDVNGNKQVDLLQQIATNTAKEAADTGVGAAGVGGQGGAGIVGGRRAYVTPGVGLPSAPLPINLSSGTGVRPKTASQMLTFGEYSQLGQTTKSQLDQFLAGGTLREDLGIRGGTPVGMGASIVDAYTFSHMSPELQAKFNRAATQAVYGTGEDFSSAYLPFTQTAPVNYVGFAGQLKAGEFSQLDPKIQAKISGQLSREQFNALDPGVRADITGYHNNQARSAAQQLKDLKQERQFVEKNFAPPNQAQLKRVRAQSDRIASLRSKMSPEMNKLLDEDIRKVLKDSSYKVPQYNTQAGVLGRENFEGMKDSQLQTSGLFKQNGQRGYGSGYNVSRLQGVYANAAGGMIPKGVETFQGLPNVNDATIAKALQNAGLGTSAANVDLNRTFKDIRSAQEVLDIIAENGDVTRQAAAAQAQELEYQKKLNKFDEKEVRLRRQMIGDYSGQEGMFSGKAILGSKYVTQGGRMVVHHRLGKNRGFYYADAEGNVIPGMQATESEIAQQKALERQRLKQLGGQAVSGAAIGVMMAASTKKQVGEGAAGKLGKDLFGMKGNEQVIEETAGDKAGRIVGAGLGGALGSFLGPFGSMIGSTIGEGAASVIATLIHRSELEMKQRVADAKKNIEAINNISSAVSEIKSTANKELLETGDYKALQEYNNKLISQLVNSETGTLLTDFLDTYKKLTGDTNISLEKIEQNTLSSDAIIRRETMNITELALAIMEREESENALEEKKSKWGKKIKLEKGAVSMVEFGGSDIETKYQLVKKYLDELRSNKEHAPKLMREILEAEFKTLQDDYADYLKEMKALREQDVNIGMLASGAADMTYSQQKTLGYKGIIDKIADAMEEQGAIVRDAGGVIKSEYLSQIELAIKKNDVFAKLLKGETKTVRGLLAAQNELSGAIAKSGVSEEDLLNMLKTHKVEEFAEAAKKAGMSVEKLTGIVYSEPTKAFTELAHAMGVTTEQLKKLEDKLGDISFADTLLKPSEVREKFSAYSDYFSNFASIGALTPENLEKALESNPEMLKTLRSGDSMKILSKIVQEGFEDDNAYKTLYKNALGNWFSASEEFFTQFKEEGGKELADAMEEIFKNAGPEGEELKKLWGDAATFDDVQRVLMSNAAQNSKVLQEKLQEYYDFEIEIKADTTQLDKVMEYEVHLLDKQIENLQNQKEALGKINDERKKEVELIKAKDALENAKKQKKRVYRKGVGWVYEADDTAIAEAQEKVEELDTQKKQEDIQTEIDRLNLQKEIYESLPKEREWEAIEKVWEQWGEKITENNKLQGSYITTIADAYQLIEKLDFGKWNEDLRKALGESKEGYFKYERDSKGEIVDISGSVAQKAAVAKEKWLNIGDAKTDEERSTAISEYNEALKALLEESQKAYNAGVSKEDLAKTMDWFDLGTHGTSESGKTYVPGLYKGILSGDFDYDKYKVKDIPVIIRGVKQDSWDTGRQDERNIMLREDRLSGNEVEKFFNTWDHLDFWFSGAKDWISYEEWKKSKMGTPEYNDISASTYMKYLPDNTIVYGSGYRRAYVKNGALYWTDAVDDEGNVQRANENIGEWANTWATGVLSTSSLSPSLINELGTEAIVTPQGTLTALPAKTGVVPADITKNLWNLGEIAPTLVAKLNSLNPQIGSSSIGNTTYEEGQYIDNLTMNVYPAKGDDFNRILEQARAQVRLTRHNN